MSRRSRALPLTRAETIWVSSATVLTAMTLMFSLTGLDLSTLFFERVRAADVHDPLPDLCTALPGGILPGTPAPHPQFDRRTVDRNEVGCTFETARAGSRPGLMVILRAHRPDPDTYGGQNDGARRQFHERYDSTGGPYTPLPGLGTEAKIKTSSDESSRNAEVVIRDGLLLVEVIYQTTDFPDGDPRTDLATVRATAQRLAAELLKVLPAK
ncbi:hypothetical protein [Actinomadura sp. HBU206391]|uniref:hypothetical protein n=1 Tax=Actinomadura sp. HBU206391 TaxID=2731692 RepID=UPI00165077D3|nr:hypothetical protein [Actinomadura sp. HBU206391]MBC6456624.1 hypothetical protein [Actinomadura sp. HBU206391]